MAGAIPRRGDGGWYAEDLDDLLERVEALEEAVQEIQSMMTNPASSQPVSDEDRLLKDFFLSVIRQAQAQATNQNQGAITVKQET